MPITTEKVREGLPNRGEPRVTDSLIEGFIASWEREVARAAGETLVTEDDPTALEIVRLGATGDAWAIWDAEMSNESPRSEQLIALANGKLKRLDEVTSRSSESGSINKNVSQTFSKQFWTEEQFLGGLNDGGTLWPL